MRKYIWVLLTACAFGTMEIALKIGGGMFSAFQLTFLRFLIGGLFLLPFAVRDLKKRHYSLTIKDFGYLTLLGLVGIVGSMTMFQMSVQHANANMAAILISINPVFTMVFANFIVGEKFTAKKAVVLAVCLLGLVFVANPMHLASGNEPLGIMLGLGASLTFGLYTALSKRIVGRVGGMTVNSVSFLIGAFFEFLVVLAMGESPFAHVGPDTFGILAYAGLVVTGFGYFCFMRAIEFNGASTASYAFFIKPIIAVSLAALILSEPITWNIVIGVAIIVAGCVFNVYEPGQNGRGLRAAASTFIAAISGHNNRPHSHA